MSEDPKLLAFHAELEGEITEDARPAGGASDESHRESAFTGIVAERLEVAGVLESNIVCFYEGGQGPAAMKVNGYSIPEEENRLMLFVSLYFGPTDQIETINASEVEAAFRKLERFFKRAREGMHTGLEPGLDPCRMAERIHGLNGQMDRVSLLLLTNARVAQRKERERRPDIAGVPATYEIWDLERLRRLAESGASYETLAIDLRKLPGGGLPAVSVNSRGFRTWITAFPGALLADLYDEHGQRLLELNVRSYLQSKGKINKGILETLRTNPRDFMSYNNGITVVAEEVSTGRLEDGREGIVALKGMQIVNGGQTTASIHRAVKVFGADLSDVSVQGKITVVEPSRFQEIVPLISQYSNTQNKVSVADLTANHQFHVGMERVSRREWTPDQQTRWFYERTRGSYQTARTREGTTAAKRREFERRNPPQQRFTKEDLARFENAWSSLPHLISRGAQKNFVHFMQAVGARPDGWEPATEEYRRAIAKGILFRSVQTLVRQSKVVTAYQINVAAYTAALLSDRTARRIDLDRIWREQAISPAMSETIEAWIPIVFLRLPEQARKDGKNTEESFKSQACWDHVRQADLRLPAKLDQELVSSVGTASVTAAEADTPVRKPEKLTTGDHNNIAICKELSEGQWLAIAKWGQKTESLEEWQRGLARSLSGQSAEKWKKEPSKRQAKYGAPMVEAARKAGVLESS